MGWYLRKSLKIGPVKFNLSKSGIGTSVGVKGFRIGVRPNGKSYVHAGRHGLYYRQELGNAFEGDTQEQKTDKTVASDANTTRYESATSKDLISSSHKEMLTKLNQSYKSLRIDYVLGIIFLILVLAVVTSNQITAIIVGILGVSLFIITARWETKRRTVQLVYAFEDEQGCHFKEIIDGFNNLVLCKNVWALIDSREINTAHEAKQHAGASNVINRSPVQLGEGKPPWVETNIDVPIMKTRGQTLYMMPDGILVYDDTGVGFVDYNDLTVDANTTRFIEENPPSDAKIVGSTWKHPNKKGGPDRRFSNNYEIPISLYGELHIQSSKGMHFYFMTSKNDAPMKFKNQLLKYEFDPDRLSEECASQIEVEERLINGEIIDTNRGAEYRKKIEVNKEVEAQTMPITCPNCNKNFETEVTLSGAKKAGTNIPVEVKTTCPHCNHPLKGIITMQAGSKWLCDYCDETFSSQEEAEEHERTCGER